MQIEIKADLATIYSLTSGALPNGVTLERSPTKSLSTQLIINIDPAEIIKSIAIASWLVAAAIHSLRRGKDVYVEGKSLPPDETRAVKMVKDIIDAEEKENQARE